MAKQEHDADEVLLSGATKHGAARVHCETVTPRSDCWCSSTPGSESVQSARRNPPQRRSTGALEMPAHQADLPR